MRTINKIPKKKPRAIKLPRSPVLVCMSRDIRKQHGLTMRDVAEHSGVPLATIQRMEYGLECELSNAIRLSTFYETCVNKLWRLK